MSAPFKDTQIFLWAKFSYAPFSHVTEPFSFNSGHISTGGNNRGDGIQVMLKQMVFVQLKPTPLQLYLLHFTCILFIR